MRHKRSTGVILAILLLVMLTGCGTIKAMFNGAHDVYLSGQKAWDQNKNGSLALLKMAETINIDPEYEAPKEFIITNYNAIISGIENKLAALPEDNFKDLKERTDIYNNMIEFYSYVADGTLVNPVVFKEKVQLIETVDYTDNLEKTSILVISEGIKEGKYLIKDRKFDDAEDIFKILLSDFLEGDKETARRTEIAAAYAAKARELANSDKLDDVELGFKVVGYGSDYEGNLPELQSAKKALNDKKGEILLAEAKSLIRKKDTASLASAYNIYKEVISIFPENETYKQEAEAIRVDIAEALYDKASQMESSFDGKRTSYDKIIETYNAADTWVTDYNGLRAKRDAFQKNAVIEIFIAVRHSQDDNTLQRLLAETVAKQLPKDRMFEIVSLNSPEGRELASQVDMGSIPMGLAENYGFEYIVVADNFRNSRPQLKSGRSEEDEVCDYISEYGRISKMSDSEKTAWSFSAALTGDGGRHLTYNSISSELRAAFDEDGVDEIWFNVRNTEVYEKLWHEGRLDYSLSFYDVTSRRNWSKAQKIEIKTHANEGRSWFSTDTDSYRLADYLSAKYPVTAVDQPSINDWEGTVLSKIKASFKDVNTASIIISNIK